MVTADGWQVELGEGVTVAWCGDVFVQLWSGPATVARGQWMTARMRGFLAGRTGQVIGTTLILPTSTPPDGTSRALLKEVIAELAPRFRLLVTLPVGPEMWALLVRMVMRGVSLFSGELRSVVARDVAEAVALVDDASGPDTPTTAGLKQTLQQLLAAEPRWRG